MGKSSKQEKNIAADEDIKSNTSSDEDEPEPAPAPNPGRAEAAAWSSADGQHIARWLQGHAAASAALRQQVEDIRAGEPADGDPESAKGSLHSFQVDCAEALARWLHVTPDKRQLNWIAKALVDGSDAARQDLLSLFDMQANILMLSFGGACGFFSMLPGAPAAARRSPMTAPADGGRWTVPADAAEAALDWHALSLMLGSVAMLVPLVGAALILILAGNVRCRPNNAFVRYLCDSRTLTAVPSVCVILSGFAFRCDFLQIFINFNCCATVFRPFCD